MSELFRDTIANRILVNRPNLSPNSLKTYVSILFNLHKHLKQENYNIEWFNAGIDDIVNHYLKNKPSQSRKSILSALYVLTNNEKYREMMIKDCKIVNNNYKTQQKSNKEKINWTTTEEIKEKYTNLHEKVIKMFKKTAISDASTIIEYLLIALLGGVLPSLPPRRSLDMALLKIRNYSKTDNYYKSGKLYFNKYKTSDKYGLQVLEVPEELNTIIKKWIKINEGDYLLFSSNGNPLTSSQITRMLNKIFDGKKISVDMLRHIYLTNYYKHMPDLIKMEKLASDMGHSINTAMTYIKKDE